VRQAKEDWIILVARYYSSVIGRWMTPDWSEEPSPVPYAKLTIAFVPITAHAATIIFIAWSVVIVVVCSMRILPRNTTHVRDS
jgi:hypothetical protein